MRLAGLPALGRLWLALFGARLLALGRLRLAGWLALSRLWLAGWLALLGGLWLALRHLRLASLLALRRLLATFLTALGCLRLAGLGSLLLISLPLSPWLVGGGGLRIPYP